MLLYLNAVKKNQDLQLTIDELTAKLETSEDLRSCFCRIFEICEECMIGVVKIV